MHYPPPNPSSTNPDQGGFEAFFDPTNAAETCTACGQAALAYAFTLAETSHQQEILGLQMVAWEATPVSRSLDTFLVLDQGFVVQVVQV